jgi:hypothetical protein
MNRLLLEIGAGLLLVLGLVLALWRLAVVSDELEDAKAQLKTGAANEKIVTKYVDRIVKVPGPAVIRDRIVRGVCHTIELPGPGGADAAAPVDTVAGRGDRAGEAELAAESLRNAKLNQEQCGALLEVLRPQVRRSQ